MILGLAGHIDHGKTALVRALTGVDTDRLPEEKRRGITIELGFAPLALPGIGTVGVVDVPGHEAFVRTMLAGASGIDLALLVVAADEGIMPQTREHLAILDLLAVRGGAIALTKCDLVDGEWLELVREDVRSAVEDSVLATAPIVATSASTGLGLDELRAVLAGLAAAVPARPRDDLFRMPVDRVFTIKGTGTVVTGTVWSGRLQRDASVRLLPQDRLLRVRALQAHGASVDCIEAGTRAAVALAGIETSMVERGSVIVDADAPWTPATRFRADVTLLPDAAFPLRPRTRVRLHVGTADVCARVVSVGGALAPGEKRPARIATDEPVVLRAGDRFVLRSASPVATIGGGIVTDSASPPRARPFPGTGLSGRERLVAIVHEAGLEGIAVGEALLRVGKPNAERDASHVEGVRAVGQRLVPIDAYDRMREELRALVAEHQRTHPLDPGLPAQLARSRFNAPSGVLDQAISELTVAGELELRGSVLTVAGWQPKLSARHEETASTVLERLAAAGFEPPTVAELGTALGAGVEDVLRFLERRGDVVQVEPGRYYTAPQVSALLDRLRAGMAAGRSYNPSELRELLGFSRKYLIPFLEYCDRIGFTVRSEAGRVRR